MPGLQGGEISIVETNDPTGCSPACIGQEVSANVRDGAFLTPYLKWELDITGTGAGINKGGILHINDDGSIEDFRYTNANVCSNAADVDCFDLYQVDKRANVTKIIFRTDTNGRVKAS